MIVLITSQTRSNLKPITSKSTIFTKSYLRYHCTRNLWPNILLFLYLGNITWKKFKTLTSRSDVSTLNPFSVFSDEHFPREVCLIGFLNFVFDHTLTHLRGNQPLKEDYLDFLTFREITKSLKRRSLSDLKYFKGSRFYLIRDDWN